MIALMRIEPNEYVIDRDLVDRAEAAKVCDVVLAAIGPRIVKVTIDEYSDYDDDMPSEVRDAQDALRQIGQRQHGRDPGMGVELRMDRPEERHLLDTYGSWSINVELLDDQSDMIASFHDCALSVCFKASAPELAQVREQLGEGIPVANLMELRHRAQEEKRVARAQRLDRLLDGIGLRPRG
jgi:hypothetical protein